MTAGRRRGGGTDEGWTRREPVLRADPDRPVAQRTTWPGGDVLIPPPVAAVPPVAAAETAPGPQRRRNLDVLLAMLSPLDGLCIVDVGCGDGTLVRALAEGGGRVVGVECNPRQLERARDIGVPETAVVVSGVGQALPVADGWADWVVFFNSLHHIALADQSRALAEAARVLRPGGRVYAAEPSPEGAFFEAVRPIDDETWMRGAAQATLGGGWTHGLIAQDSFTYLHPLVMRDYGSFRDRIISANPEREARFAAREDEMRERFIRLSRPAEAGGYAFEQPMRVVVLKKV